MTVFPLPSRLVANPDLYDYRHFLSFADYGTVSMVNGGGQVITSEVLGTFNLTLLSDSSCLVEFADLVSVNPYDTSQIYGPLDPFVVHVGREPGPFAFRAEVMWEIASDDEWPCLLFEQRYRFEPDPLNCVAHELVNNPYHLITGRGETAKVEYYYGPETRLRARELIELGIPKETFW